MAWRITAYADWAEADSLLNPVESDCPISLMQPRALYLYTVWFFDESAAPETQDREWPACFIVEAPTNKHAQDWGDYLSKGFAARRRSERFIRSVVELAQLSDPAVAALPRVVAGIEASDAHIGW